MRIHALEVKDFRGIDHYRLEVPEAGVLVVEGPNEAGKSTLVRALDMLLTEKATAKKQYVKDTQPIGRDEGPAVTAELTVGGQRFTYSKQWVKGPRTEFRPHGPGQPLTGDDAHNHVVALLDEHGDETLRKALQLLQEGPLVVDGLGESRRLTAALDAVAGGDTGQDLDQAASLVERVESDAGAYWTASGRESGELKRLRGEQEAAVQAEERARAAVEALEGDVRRVAALADAEERAAEAVTAAAARRAEAEEAWASTEAERAAAATAQEALVTARRDHERAVADQVAREALLAEAAEAAEAEAVAEEVREAALEPQQAAEESVAQVVARREEAEQAEAEARAASRTAEDQVALARAAAELTTLQRAVERLDALRERQRAIRALLEGDVVDDDALARITTAQDALRTATARRDAASPRLRVAGDASVPVVLDGRELPADERPWEAPVGAATLLEVAGVEVHVLPPRGADDSEVEAARRALSEALSEVGAQDVAHAHRLHAAVQRAAADRDAVDAELETALEGRSVEDWRADAADARVRVEQAEGEAPSVSDAQAAALTAREALEAAREAAEAVRAEEGAARETAATRRAALDRAEVQRDAAAAAVARVQDRVAAARELVTDDAARAAVESTRHAVADAEHQVADRQEALAAAGSVSEEDLQSVRVAAERAEDRHRRARDEHLRAEAMLAQVGQEGRAEDLDAARTHLEQVTEAFTRVQARAEALKLLLTTLRSRRAEAQASYVQPFREALEELGSVLHPEGFAVEVAPDLSIVSRSVGGLPVPLEGLSTGAREQLSVLSRLAVAKVVDADEGMPVVLDDALGWSDPDRLRRMARALERAGADAQVLVLTCTPGRYDAIAGATVRTVEDLRAAAVG